MKQFKIALIGCGRIGFLLENDPLRNKPCTHFGGAESAGLKIKYACDIKSDRLKKFAAMAGIDGKNLYNDYKKMIDDVKPDMFIISTWTNSHFDISTYAIKNGAKLIIMEKPITPDLRKAKQLIDECAKKKINLIINHERRYDSRYMKVKSMIKDGCIGTIKSVHASILTGGHGAGYSSEMGGGPLLHDGTHLIDIIRFFFGEIKSVEGEFQRSNRTGGFEDRATAWMKTENNIDIFLEAGGNREYFVFELAISGTEGKIIIGNGYEKLLMKKRSKFYTGFMDLEEKAFPKFKKNNCFTKLYSEARGILIGKNIASISSGIDGYKALETIHAIYLSSSLNRKKIDLPLPYKKVDIKKIFNLK